MKKIEGTFLTQLKFLYVNQKGSVYLYKCECGIEKEIVKSNVTSGHTRSCGCFRDRQSLINLERGRAKNRGVKFPNQTGSEKGQFKKGSTPWNKGKICGPHPLKGKMSIRYPNGRKEWI